MRSEQIRRVASGSVSTTSSTENLMQAVGTRHCGHHPAMMRSSGWGHFETILVFDKQGDIVSRYTIM